MTEHLTTSTRRVDTSESIDVVGRTVAPTRRLITVTVSTPHNVPDADSERSL